VAGLGVNRGPLGLKATALTTQFTLNNSQSLQGATCQMNCKQMHHSSW